MNEDYWEIRRAQYRALAVLCEQIDQTISSITIIALANNLFFVCVQLLRSLRFNINDLFNNALIQLSFLTDHCHPLHMPFIFGFR